MRSTFDPRHESTFGADGDKTTRPPGDLFRRGSIPKNYFSIRENYFSIRENYFSIELLQKFEVRTGI